MAPTSDTEAPAVVRLLGVPLAAMTEAEVVAKLVGPPPGERGGWVCPVNLDVLRQIDGSREVRELIAEADLHVPDGMPLLVASRLLGEPLPERVAGSSLITTVPAAAAAAGRSLFFLGGNPGTADAAAQILRERHPGLQIAGTLCPEFGFERDPAALAAIDDALAAASPDIIFVGLGFPKQERLIERLRPLMPGSWFVSCGISFSFVSGEVQRAPQWVQRLGLEWAHRLFQEPGRLAHRYLVDGPPFVLRLVRHALGRRVRRRPTS